MNKGFAQELLIEEHNVGPHAIHRKDYKDFSGELNTISKRFDRGVCGFIKHSTIVNYDVSERLSGYMNTSFEINAALRRVCL
jgi:hypothetical protein